MTAVAVDVVVAGNAVLVDNAVDHHDCSSSSSHHLYHYNADQIGNFVVVADVPKNIDGWRVQHYGEAAQSLAVVATVKEEICSYSYPEPRTVVQYYHCIQKILEVLVILEEVDAANDVVVPYYPLH